MGQRVLHQPDAAGGVRKVLARGGCRGGSDRLGGFERQAISAFQIGADYMGDWVRGRTLNNRPSMGRGGVWSAVGFACLMRTISFSSAPDFSRSPSAR